MEKERLRSYFDESMIYDGIMDPTGNNIAPHFLSRKKIKGITVTGEFKTDVNYEDAADMLSDEALMVRGNFNYGIVREFIEPVATSYEMYDSGAFNALVRMEDETCVSIKTDIGINRRSIGQNFDGFTIYDGMFPNMNHESSRNMITYHEYYKILDNGMQMIHYSDATYPDDDILFEMYAIPDEYKVSDGLGCLPKPTVFNLKTFNKQHPAYREIKGLLEPKQKVKCNVIDARKDQEEAKKGYYFK